MSAAARRRKRAGYEPDAPRCATCQHYRRAKLALRNSLPYHVHAHCTLGDFIVDRNGCCDHWFGVDGTVLPIAASGLGKAVEYLIGMRKVYQAQLDDIAPNDQQGRGAVNAKINAIQKAIGRIKSGAPKGDA